MDDGNVSSVKLSAVSKLTVSPRARIDAKEAQVREKLEDCLKQATELTGRAGNTVSSLVQLAAVLINAIRLTSNPATTPNSRPKLALVYSL